jgi:hypothetical protein
MSTLIRFVRKVSIQPSVDFNSAVKVEYTKLLIAMYFKEKFTFLIDEFLYLFKLENLTEKCYKNYIENDLHIKFISMTLDFIYHQDRKNFELYSENKDNFKFGSWRFVCFSNYDYEFISDDGTTLKVFINNNFFDFNIQELKNMNISYQTIETDASNL